jgi:DNA-3-methyladenine glycosylase
MILSREFYVREDTLIIAKDLLGKRIVTKIDNLITSGLIIETEAYLGQIDRASHAFGGRRTKRTETMYAIGGTAYIYLCYGMHGLFNVVTNQKDHPHAVLIRAIYPEQGIAAMVERVGKKSITQKSGIGPGRLTKLLGIHVKQNGMDLTESGNNPKNQAIWIEDTGIIIPASMIEATPRIGIDYAGEDVSKPYRFVIKKGATWMDTP